MASELLPFDRRMISMSILLHHKKITRRSLAKELSVSYATIGRDLNELSRYIPIYTRMGRYGGIYLSDEYNEPKLYLSSDEDTFLIDLLKTADDREQLIINSILNKFSMPKMS